MPPYLERSINDIPISLYIQWITFNNVVIQFELFKKMDGPSTAEHIQYIQFVHHSIQSVNIFILDAFESNLSVNSLRQNIKNFHFVLLLHQSDHVLREFTICKLFIFNNLLHE